MGPGRGLCNFKFWMEDVDLSKWSLPVTMQLVIGNDLGETSR